LNLSKYIGGGKDSLRRSGILSEPYIEEAISRPSLLSGGCLITIMIMR
jgi:hypothetical protein